MQRPKGKDYDRFRELKKVQNVCEAPAEAAEADMNQLGMDPPKLCKLGLDV